MTCGSTLLNHLKKISLPQFAVPKILGVDDFAFCKGQRYGTILVDLELNQPIALLADRKAATLTDWLIQHPRVEILSRDRSKTSKSAMDKGAPAATQVADRFHLVQNLEETLEWWNAQIRQPQSDAFDDWLMKALKSSLKPFVQFAEGLYPIQIVDLIGEISRQIE
jgi:transposase